MAIKFPGDNVNIAMSFGNELMSFGNELWQSVMSVSDECQ